MKTHACSRAAFQCMALLFLASVSLGAAPAQPPRILCTTFPLYQIARNIAAGREGVKPTLLLPPGMGCPHDYVLAPQDLTAIASADILIVNGLGLEDFLGAPLQRANPRAKVIDSSKGAGGLLEIAPEEGGGNQAATPAGRDAGNRQAGLNPHLFASPGMSAKLVQNIAAEMAKFDPQGAAVYSKNAKAYAERLSQLAKEFAETGKRLKAKRIVTEHAVFDYLARDMGLEIVAVIEEHPGQDPSAAQMLSIVKRIKASGAAAVFAEPQYSAKVAGTIAREAVIPVAQIDPVASGPANAPLDYYEKTMSANLETLKKTLGYDAK